MLNIIGHRGYANQNYNEIHLTTIGMARIKKGDNKSVHNYKKKLEALYIADQHVNGAATLESTQAVPQKSYSIAQKFYS